MTEQTKKRLLRASTVEFFREGRRTRRYSLFDFIHGYIYARFPYLYIGIGTGEHPIAKKLLPVVRKITFILDKVLPRRHGSRSTPEGYHVTGTIADTYHGKVLPPQAATRLVRINQPVRVDDLEQVIPYPTARSIILRDPDHIVALECPCRAAREKPCLPLDVCLIIGEPFASFVLEHHASKARLITQLEAEHILREEHERGHVAHAFFKDAMLQRFYAICNCCACCCGAMQAQRSGTPMLIASGYLAQVNAALCHGCGTCSEYCQFSAIGITDGVSVIDEAICMGCGVCVSHCPQGAITLELAPSKGVPLQVEDILVQA